jgi:hypothetical protein
MRESKAQLEVWEWKREAWEEVKHLDLRSAIRKRLRDSASTMKQLQPRLLNRAKPKRRSM